jgi:7-cyano-7-deazaguanine synthase
MKKATVLFSGGIDSTSAALLLKSSGWAVRGLFIDYGQAARHLERKAVARLKDLIGITVDEIHIGSLSPHGIGELTGRNPHKKSMNSAICAATRPQQLSAT